LFVFDLGYFKLTACAQIAAAQAYFLSRLNPHTTLREVRGGRVSPLALAHVRGQEARPLLEKRSVLGAAEQVAARLIAVRLSAAIVNERRRQARTVAKQRGYTPSRAHRALLAWNLFITKVPGPVWTAQTICKASTLRWQGELVFKAWKSHLPLATLTTTTQQSTRWYLYGRRLLIVVTFALCPTLRATVWQKQPREVSLIKLIRHFQAGAAQWRQVLFQSPRQLTAFLSQACAAAERLVRKAVRNRRTSAQHLRDSLGSQVDFFEPALALAA